MAVRALSQRKHAVGSIYTVTHCFQRRSSVVVNVVSSSSEKNAIETRPQTRANLSLAKTSHATLRSSLVVYRRPRIVTNYVITENGGGVKCDASAAQRDNGKKEWLTGRQRCLYTFYARVR